MTKHNDCTKTTPFDEARAKWEHDHTPDRTKVTSFDVARAKWERHNCESECDVCGCKFYFECTQCGMPLMAHGEGMQMLVGIGGKCDTCYYGVKTYWS